MRARVPGPLFISLQHMHGTTRNMNNLKIGVRLGLLAGFFFIALLVVGAGGWLIMNSIG